MQLRERVIYGDAPGTGKTPTTCQVLDPDERNLVVAPLSVLKHWHAELERAGHTPLVYRGTPKQREKLLASFPSGATLITNYEAMRGDNPDRLRALKFDTVVADEAHRLKGRNAAQTKGVKKLTRPARRAFLLTGTPILNRADECWSALNALHPQAYSSYWRWVETHFDIRITSFGGRTRFPVRIVGDLKPGHDELLRAQLMGTLIQRPIEMLLPDMPEVTETTLYVEMSSEEASAYKRLDDFNWTTVGGDVVMTATELEATGRLRQFASDWGVLSSTPVGPGAKVRAALEYISDVDEPVVVFTSYKYTAYALRDHLRSRDVMAVTYTGNESEDQREANKLAFITGKARVIIGTHGAMGEGVDGLQLASRIILMLDRDWTPARNEQAIGRVRRSGQKQGVLVVNLVIDGTIDNRVDDALAQKLDVIKAITTGAV